MRHNKRNSFLTSWSSWRILWALGLAYLNDMTAENAGVDEIQSGAADFFEKSGRKLGVANAYPYAVVKGQLLDGAGMDAHLAKPINIEQLCATLTKLMSERGSARDEKTNKEE